MLDKLLGLWYNGNAGRWGRRRHAQKKTHGIIHPTGHRATRHQGGLQGSPSTAQGPAHRSNR